MMRLRSVRKSLGDIKSLDVVLHKIFRANLKQHIFFTTESSFKR